MGKKGKLVILFLLIFSISNISCDKEALEETWYGITYKVTSLDIAPTTADVSENDSLRFTYYAEISPATTCRLIIRIGNYIYRGSWSSKSYNGSKKLYKTLYAKAIARDSGTGTFSCSIYFESDNNTNSSSASATLKLVK